MIIHASTVREKDNNVYYPRSIPINTLEDLKQAVKYDHVAARMKNSRRGHHSFLEADCLMVDLDNTHSEDPTAWKTLNDVSDTFPDVCFYAIHSRNYMKLKEKVSKDGTRIQFEPREKFHLYFPLSGSVDENHYSELAMSAAGIFPFFDLGAIDPAHFFYGVKDPQGVFIEGQLTIDQYLSSISPEEIKRSLSSYSDEILSGNKDHDKALKKLFEKYGLVTHASTISPAETSGSMNSMEWLYAVEKSRSIHWLEGWAAEFNVSLGKRYAINTPDRPNTTAICVQCPWESEHSMVGAENETVILIDNSGRFAFLCRHSHGYKYRWKEYRAEIERRSGKPGQSSQLRPNHFTDLEEATAFVKEYGSIIRFSRATGFLVFDGNCWQASEERARLLAQTFVERQAREAGEEIRVIQEAQNQFIEALKGQAIEDGSEDQVKAADLKEQLSRARSYQKNAFKYQASGKITSILKEAAPKVIVEINQLDADALLLNTPIGTVNLRTGEIRSSDPEDLCTKITACGPSDQGKKEWESFLDQVTSGDPELKNYLQIVFGMAAIGDVRQEKLLIPYGAGGNGKSTLCNAISYVLGDYAGTLSAEALTMSSRKNVGPEYAELRGKRLVIASELSEGMRLNTAIVKHLCSTDKITAEPKYKDPFSFRPSHTLILFTNHLPKVGTNDSGTWSRLVVIPFNGVFRNTSGEIMNYASELAARCGGSILQWTIEGAKQFISSGYRLPEPEAVKNAIAAYRADNDWISLFLNECCELGKAYTTTGINLYDEYSDFCIRTGEFRRTMADLKAALENIGVRYKKNTYGAVYLGIRLRAHQFQAADNTPFEAV